MANGMDMKKNECRDFMRGVCGRGNNCKFFHPPHVNPMTQHQEKLPICKDFQNKGCDRVKCKFLHITQQEEVEYDSTGNLPAHGGRSDQPRNGIGIPPGGAGGRNGGRHGGGPFPPLLMHVKISLMEFVNVETGVNSVTMQKKLGQCMENVEETILLDHPVVELVALWGDQIL